MSSKKRKTSQEDDDAEDLTAFSVSKRQRGTPSKFTATPKKANEAFKQEKKSLFCHANHQVTTVFEDALVKSKLPEVPPGKDPIFIRNSVVEFFWRLKQVVDLYNRPAGDVFVFGQEDCGQLGLKRLIGKTVDGYPPTLNQDLRGNIIQVAAGGMHSACVTDDGKTLSWGCPDEGALGRLLPDDDGGDEDVQQVASTTPTEVTGFYPSKKHAVAQDLSKSTEDGDILAVEAGVSHTVFLTISGNVYVTGMYKDHDSGEFCEPRPSDDPTKTDEIPHAMVHGKRLTPVHVYRLPQKAKMIAAGGSICAAVMEDDSLVTWGMGHSGELARSADMIKPNKEGGGFDLNRNKVFVDGEGNFDLGKVSELFLKPAPVRWAKGISPKMIVTHVSAGQGHLLVLARGPGEDFSQAYSAGLANYGQHGHGDNEPRHELTLIQALKGIPMARVAAGLHHSMFLTAKSVVYTCGRADYGQLGYLVGDMSGKGDFMDTPKPVAMPIAQDPAKVGRIVDIAAGDSHCLAITSTGKIYTWGFGEYGAAGNDPRLNTDDLRKPVLAENWFPNTELVATHISGGAQHSLLVAKRYKA